MDRKVGVGKAGRFTQQGRKSPETHGPEGRAGRQRYVDRKIRAGRQCYVDRKIRAGRECYVDRKIRAGRQCYVDRKVRAGRRMWVSRILGNSLSIYAYQLCLCFSGTSDDRGKAPA